MLSRVFYSGLLTVCCGLGAVYAATQTPMQLTGPGPNGALSSIYVGPYAATIGGGSAIPVICDDFADDTYLGESWTANIFNSTDLGNPADLSQTKWGNVGKYQEAAWLGLQLVNTPTNAACGGASNCAGDIQFAIWQLFDPGQNPIGRLTGGDASNATNWLTSAANQSYNNFTLYSYVPGTATGCPGPCTAPQEFMVVHTPEASGLALLGADFLGFAALLLLFKIGSA